MHIFIAAAVMVTVYMFYKHFANSATLAAVKAEIAKIETEAVTDAKAVVARIKSIL